MTATVLLNALCEIDAQLVATRTVALQAETDTGRPGFRRLAARASLHTINERLVNTKTALDALMREVARAEDERTLAV